MMNGIFWRSLSVLALTMGMAVPALAQQEVWGYIDAKGNTHFADRKVDPRYVLYFKGNQPPRLAANKPAGLVTGRAMLGSGLVPLDARAQATGTRLAALSHSQHGLSQLIQREAKRQGVDYALVKSVVAAESGFNTQAQSSAGAVGLMQIMPATARDLGLQSDASGTVEQKLVDPATNIRLGTRYLKYLSKKYPGRLDLVLAAYNAGHGAVQRAGNRVPRIPETQNYVRKVTATYKNLSPNSPVFVNAMAAAAANGAALDAATPAMATPLGKARVRRNRVAMTFKQPAAAPAPEADIVRVKATVPETAPASTEVFDGDIVLKTSAAKELEPSTVKE